LPGVTLLACRPATLVAVCCLTATVFAWTGIGRRVYEALLQRTLIICLLGVFVVVSAMWLDLQPDHDWFYRSVDPAFELA